MTNCCKDFLHKTSNQISKNHAMIAIEDLRIANMSRSAKGNTEEHGRNVRENLGLNTLTSDLHKRLLIKPSHFEARLL
ncbi:hypothetical protein [Candidatus Enterovibrio escicola]|uniref:hypothetical protein n=1 Tax=Candidatus Enterovibrio escicola TaxID=1927127 RepID=UPI003C1301F6